MQITRYDDILSLDHPDFWVIGLEAELWRRTVLDLYGSADLGDSAERRWAWSAHPQYSRFVRWVAVDRDAPVGVATLELPQQDNRHIGYVSVAVDPAHRERGIGTALFDEAARLASDGGRSNLQGWTYEPFPATGERRVRGTTGDGEVDADSASMLFATGLGFTLMQVDVMSALDLPPQPELERVAEEARQKAPAEYEVVQWSGRVPERWRADIADLQRAMSTDTPTGGAELEEEAFDAERIRAYDESSAAAGIERLTTAALHAPSGRLVACSSLVREPGKEDVADQWETIVERHHRGHGIGMLIKTASHAWARQHWPGLRRLVTGNASENEHMLRINRALGYAPIAASGWFERKDGDGAQ